MAEDGDGKGFNDRHNENYESKPSMIHEISNDNFVPPSNRTNPTRDSYWFAHGGIGESPSTINHSSGSGDHPATDGKEYSPQKEREEKIRVFKEQQEEERQRRLQELEQSFMVSKKYREQQEEERRRKIEEARVKEIDRRLQVEERKRQIWEAEQERKEAILRRNLEREARIEARRNAQRNSLCFAFGSSTPRTFDLDLAALGGGRGTAQLMSAISGRRSEERDFSGKRATSACSLDRKFELDYLCDDYSDASRDYNRASSLEPPSSRVNISKQLALKYMRSDETRACLTMPDSCSSPSTGSFNYISNIVPCWLTGSGAIVEGDDLMSRSMVSLSSVSRGRRKTDLTPTILRERSSTPLTMSRVSKDGPHSPSRPRSSMSGTSELSTTSSITPGVIMRPKPAPRRPRPVTIAGTTALRSSSSTAPSPAPAPKAPSPIPRALERQARPNDRQVPKSSRAKSAGSEHSSVENKSTPANKKPLPPPKTSEILAKAKSHPLSAKGNLRKPETTSDEPIKLPPSPEPQIIESSAPCDKEICIEGNIDKEVSKEVNKEDDKEVNKGVDKGVDKGVNNRVDIEVGKEEEKQDIKPVAAVSNQPQPQGVEEKDDSPSEEATSSKPRITSEEEAKAALAEKRRLAREQAEREAELERQHQEELRRQEEEQKRLEELEQKRLEEEQLRLIELHRQMEKEKLQKAIEEQEQREKEEQEQREEEARLKAEREEQERKAREEAEKQRIELEERLRKEEEERAERKRRVEQIMSRTRNRGAQPNSTSLPNSQTGSKSATPVEDNKVFISNNNALTEKGLPDAFQNLQLTRENPNPFDDDFSEGNSVMDANKFDSGIEISSNSYGTDPNFTGQLQNLTLSSSVNNWTYQENREMPHAKTNGAHNWSHAANGTYKEISLAVQTNGYSSHEEMSCTTSPEEKSEASNSSGVGVLEVGNSHELSSSVQGDQSEFDQLIDLGEVEQSVNSHRDSYLINADNVNSNIAPPGNPFIAFEENMSKKQEASLTDLL